MWECQTTEYYHCIFTFWTANKNCICIVKKVKGVAYHENRTLKAFYCLLELGDSMVGIIVYYLSNVLRKYMHLGTIETHVKSAKW